MNGNQVIEQLKEYNLENFKKYWNMNNENYEIIYTPKFVIIYNNGAYTIIDKL